MKKLNDVCLFAADTYNYGAAVSSLQKCMEQCEFDRVIFFTNIPLKIDGIEVIQIDELSGKDGYSHFILKEAYKYIANDFVLVVQHDSWILDAERFDERLYEVDYAGALWPQEVDGLKNGNGGFSWRSHKLMEAVGKDELVRATAPEDVSLCRVYRKYLEETYGLIWASDEICERFSYELGEPNQFTFGFHGSFHLAYKPTVVIKRSGALGDCLIMEPVLRHYAMKGYNIVLDIPLPFFELYNNHYFHIKHISKFDAGRIRPDKEINLDLAYEVKPKQNYLKSYFEFCGISDYQLSRPQLYPLVDERTKLFKKYAVVHIDERETLHRNTYGVNWKGVERYLTANGYTVIQIGKNDHASCGIEINTPSVGFMKFVIAGCDLFIGIDSAPSGIAVAYNRPSVILFGSVNPDYIHPDLTNVEIIQGKCPNSFCWHTVGGTEGVECKFKGTEDYLQCCKSDSDSVIDAVERLVKNKL